MIFVWIKFPCFIYILALFVIFHMQYSSFQAFLCKYDNVVSEKQVFQLRSHMYQARSLIGSDASGLSDPFARVAFGDQSVCTQVIEETLSPTWDEMLIIHEVTMYGLMQEIADTPPTIIVEVFDQDKVVRKDNM